MIIVRLSGGLGNQMFQYAFGRALSLKHKVPLKLDISLYTDQFRGFTRMNTIPREYNLASFNIAAEIAKPHEIPFVHRMYWKGRLMHLIDAVRRRIFFHEGRERSYSFNQRSKSFGPNTYLCGEWQSPKYFAGYEDVIRGDFSLKKPLSQKIERLKKEIQSKNSVCVHIRRGDYVNNSFYHIASTEYYASGLARIAQKENIDCVYVFDRDDIEWCKQQMRFDYPTVFVDNDCTVQETLALMSACKHFVLANSSFSWWAAWLADNKNKIVVCPKQWFVDPSIKSDDLISREWVKI